MPQPERTAARVLKNNAENGVIRCGHQGLYGVVDRLRAAAARLDGAKRREVLFKCDEIRKALDANMEEFVAGVRDPTVEDRAAIVDGIYNLLADCRPLYLALKSDRSVQEARDAFDEAEATLDRFTDEDEEYKEYRELNGGWVALGNRRGKVKLDAEAFAAWQAENKRRNERFEQNPYSRTAQTTSDDVKLFKKRQKQSAKTNAAVVRRTKRARDEDEDEEEATPPELEMRVLGGKGCETKKYRVMPSIYKFAPAGSSNPYTTKEKAMELAASCVANRPAGTTPAEKADARAKKYPSGVFPIETGGFMAKIKGAKKLQVTLKGPGGDAVFDTAAAAGKAIKKYEDASKPTKKSDPLYDTLVYLTYRRQ